MISEDHPQGDTRSLKKANRSTPNILQTENIFTRIQGPFSPGRILAITVLGIALAEVIAMVAVYYARHLTYNMQVLLDVVIMTVIVFPVLYVLSFRPMLQHIQKRQQSESILQARLRLMQYASAHTLDELLQFTLDETEALTGSAIGFFHFLEADQTTLWLQAWSSNTLQNMCRAEGKGSHYDIEQAGVWADAVRSRQPLIHNNYSSLPGRKGMPEGHAAVVRELVVPILREGKVVAILGVGNKAQDYTDADVKLVATLADFAWDVVEQKKAENSLRQSEQKFRNLVDWTYDWEKWVDPQGRLVYTSPSCQRITGYTPAEFLADPGLLARIVHPEDQQLYTEHVMLVHDPSAGPAGIEYRVVARDGSQHWIEHLCRPLFSPDGQYLGRRVSNRDITKRKLAEKQISEQNQKELILTQTIRTIQTDIARDLHDTLGQNISFLRLNLAHLAETQVDDHPAGIKTQIQSMNRAAEESYDLIRSMLAVLQRGVSADPLSLFTRYAEQVAERSSIQCEITSHGHPQPLSEHQIRQLFYIFREALSNVEKYACADRVTGEFTWGDAALRLVICDDGCGFDLQATLPTGHYGLKFMGQRAELLKGALTIQSSPGRGTQITVSVPYDYELT